MEIPKIFLFYAPGKGRVENRLAMRYISDHKQSEWEDCLIFNGHHDYRI